MSTLSEILHVANKETFSPKGRHLKLLKSCPEVIPTLAQWSYEEWHLYDHSLTKEKLVRSLLQRLNEDSLPLTLVLLNHHQPIGSISLKKRSLEEFVDFPADSLWMGSLYITPEERSQGLGEELLSIVVEIARLFSHDKLYFYTSNPVNVPWYQKRGALVIMTREFRGHDITIMSMSLE